MLALTTGWQPDTLGTIPDPFRRACHWALYARALAGRDGFPSIEIPKGAPVEVRLEAMKSRAEVATLRSALYPEDGE